MKVFYCDWSDDREEDDRDREERPPKTKRTVRLKAELGTRTGSIAIQSDKH